MRPGSGSRPVVTLLGSTGRTRPNRITLELSWADLFAVEDADRGLFQRKRMPFSEGEPAAAFSDLLGIVATNAAPKVEARLRPSQCGEGLVLAVRAAKCTRRTGGEAARIQ